MENINSINLTQLHLFSTAKEALSSRVMMKYTITDLERQSQKGRSVIYYHFQCMEDFYFELFEKYIIAEVTKGCSSYEELVVSVVDFILSNKILCQNLANLSNILNKPDYLLNKFASCFNKFELPDNKLKPSQYHLMGGIVHTIQTWFEKDLKLTKVEMVDQLLEQGDLLRNYLK
ncbi:hypothetical protein [Companilactobacillus zhongbaensis]|uniref:hypothetical protein n=1 Tax=Companilactobacillus zhongbaensis TaxID=2486009 RepID=UPI000F771BDC|nr:hypothetical protein [Companilactobacillus zhongbaensis]